MHLTTPFEAGEFEPFGHRSQIRRVIVEDTIVEAALALAKDSSAPKMSLVEPETSASMEGRVVSLRALLGKPPYGTV